MTKDEALDLALEALEQIASAMPFPVGSRAITAIEQARSAPVLEPVDHLLAEITKLWGVIHNQQQQLAAQPAVQEPLGYLEIDDIESQSEYPHNCRNVNLWHEGGQGMAAIYTAPPAAQRLVAEPHKWVGLTDEDKRLFSSWLDDKEDDEVFEAIEAKLKEKNT